MLSKYKLFSVVHFIKENTVEVIPTKWISENFTKCKSPDFQTLSKIQFKPNAEVKDKWKSFKITVKSQSDIFSKAKSQAHTLQFTSNVESSSSADEATIVTKKRKIRPKKNFQEEQQDYPRKTKRPAINIDSSSDDQESLNHVSSLKNLSPLYQSSESEVDDRQQQGSPDAPSEIAIPHRFQEVLLNELHTLKTDVEIVRSFVVRSSGVSRVHCPFRVLWNCDEDVKVAEEILTNEQEAFRTCCRSIGGRSAEDHLRRILSKLFGHEFSHTYNFTGKGGKKAYRKLIASEVVAQAVLESHNTTRYVIDDIAGKWFRWGKDRNGGRMKRQQKDTA
ncbi:unnamed protein product [Allacma fusca]|uniref:DUF4806 domain-containing protein n=1 Tax=Allacma fusca TaxID=39272 RepID=A0A8J2PM66_9HEXA|nr:unnamed protein product [Allacma fusca]